MANVRRLRRQRNELGPYKRHELLTGEIIYAATGYSGYGDGTSTDLADFIDETMKADWEANREELLEFWKTGEHTVPSIFPDSKPWMFVRGSADILPWAERELPTCE